MCEAVRGVGSVARMWGRVTEEGEERVTMDGRGKEDGGVRGVREKEKRRKGQCSNNVIDRVLSVVRLDIKVMVAIATTRRFFFFRSSAVFSFVWCEFNCLDWSCTRNPTWADSTLPFFFVHVSCSLHTLFRPSGRFLGH